MSLPKGWTQTTFGELASFQNGNSFKAADWSSKGLPIIRIQNLNGSGEFNYYPHEPDEKWVVRPGDLLFAWAGVKGVSFGPCKWHGPKGVLNQHIFLVKPDKKISYGWFYQYLMRATKEIESKAHGFKSSLVHIQKSELVDRNVLLPPSEEQEKIAEILSTWDRAIELLQGVESLVNKMIPVVVSHLLKEATDISSIRDISSVISKGSTPTTYGHEYTEEGVKFLRVENITEKGTLDFSDVKYISEMTHQFLKRSRLQADDILFSIAGAIGRTAIVQENDLPLNTNQAVAFIRPNKSIVRSDFVRLALATYAQGGQITKLQAGNAQKNYNLEQVGNIEIPLFSLEQQDVIVSSARVIYQNMSQTSAILALLKKQKLGLMQKLLTGNVRVKV